MTDLLSVFDVLIDAVVPVSCIFSIGYLSGIFRVFDKQQALTILKFVGMFGVPSISASILITTDVTAMDFDLSLSYLAVEVAVYLFAAAIARVVFTVGIAEALIIGMACSFSNHVLFIYPISQFLFDETLLQPIKTIIATDVIVLTLSIIVLDFITSSRQTLSAHIVKQITNPALVGFAIGLGLVMIPGGVPISLERTSLFIAQSAAPTALFVSGILLSQKSDARNFQLASVITIIKVGVFPLIALMLIVWGRGYDLDTAKTTMLVAVAPVGLMALTFAPRYNVETGPIAIAMLWSMIISICLIPIIVVLS